MLIIGITVLSAFTFPSIKAVDENSSWTAMTPMPTARSGLGVAVVNGKIYAIGGSSGNSPVNNNEEYDPISNQWTVEMPMPTARSGFAIAVYNNKIYVIGGTVGNGYVSNNEVYDPSTNTWETKAPMPTPRSDLVASVVNDEIYLVGGKRYSSIDPYFNGTNVNEVYDPSNNTWSTKTAIPTAVYGYSSATINGKIYVIGGTNNPTSSQNDALINANQVYDPQTDSWSLLANLPTLDIYGAAAATEDYMVPSRIYFVGGYFWQTFSSKTQIYNPSNNSWTTGPSLPAPRAYFGLAVVNDILYAIGGFDGQNTVNTNYEYIPADYGTAPPKLQITSPENKTYSQVSLNYSINKGVDWTGYSLDNQANVTITKTTGLFGLSQGSHSIIVYANDSQGYMGASNPIYFSVDSVPPTIMIMIPQNQSYSSTDLQLTFIVDKPVSALSYNLDGEGNISIVGNVTLPALSDGSHSLTVYATDSIGNSGLAVVYFRITSFPFIIVAATASIITIALAAGFLFYKHRKSTPIKTEKANLIE